MHDQNNCGLIDWLMPTLAVSQLYHGRTIVNLLILENKGSLCHSSKYCISLLSLVYLGITIILWQELINKAMLVQGWSHCYFYDHHHELIDHYEIFISQMTIDLFSSALICFSLYHWQDFYWTWLKVTRQLSYLYFVRVYF